MRPAAHGFPSRARRAGGRGWGNTVPTLLHQDSAWHRCPLTRITVGHGQDLTLVTQQEYLQQPLLFLRTGFLVSFTQSRRQNQDHSLFSSVRTCRCIWAQLQINSDVVCWEKSHFPIAFPHQLDEHVFIPGKGSKQHHNTK